MSAGIGTSTNGPGFVVDRSVHCGGRCQSGCDASIVDQSHVPSGCRRASTPRPRRTRSRRTGVGALGRVSTANLPAKITCDRSMQQTGSTWPKGVRTGATERIAALLRTIRPSSRTMTRSRPRRNHKMGSRGGRLSGGASYGLRSLVRRTMVRMWVPASRTPGSRQVRTSHARNRGHMSGPLRCTPAPANAGANQTDETPASAANGGPCACREPVRPGHATGRYSWISPSRTSCLRI
jgi:hypothetical protein